jgi:hypothetical protein
MQRAPSAPALYAPEVLRDIEAELSGPRFRGIPLGPALNQVCMIELYYGRGDWSRAAHWKDWGRRVKHYLRPPCGRGPIPPLSPGRVLVIWRSANYRISELVLPVVRELDPRQCSMFCASESMTREVPVGAEALSWKAIPLDRAAWRAEYRRCRPEWHRRLRGLCRKHRLPRGAFGRLADHMMLASQCVASSLPFLKAARPRAVLAECDRDFTSSCVVLSARSLGIPTYTLVHGVLNEQAVGYVPVLADRVFCWGELQRRQFLAAGEDPAKVVVAGCPRLTRELAVTAAQARVKLGLDSRKPVMLLGTNPTAPAACLEMAEMFCVAVGRLPGVSAVVRLHPSERLEVYAPVAQRYPAVRFTSNSDATLDEALAAADVVVVPNSGLGSDALVKRRLVIVLDLLGLPPGHGRDLVDLAGCPRVTDAEGLAAAAARLLFDDAARRECAALAERFVGDSCAAFGRDAAARIAACIGGETAGGPG